jgi:hypothetical protein
MHDRCHVCLFKLVHFILDHDLICDNGQLYVSINVEAAILIHIFFSIFCHITHVMYAQAVRLSPTGKMQKGKRHSSICLVHSRYINYAKILFSNRGRQKQMHRLLVRWPFLSRVACEGREGAGASWRSCGSIHLRHREDQAPARI